MNALSMEFYKCRRKKIPYIILAASLMQLLWIGYNLQNMEIPALGWSMTIYDLMLINAIILPFTCAILASRSCEIEHQGSTWKLLETIVPPIRLFHVKLIWGALHIAVFLLVQLALFLMLGMHLGFPTAIPMEKMLLYFFLNFFISLAIYVLQLSLSLVFQNQAIPLIIGIFGSFIGLLSMFFPVWVQRVLLWGYYGVLLLAAIDWDRESRTITPYWVSIQMVDVVLLVLWLAALYILGRILFLRKEV